MTTSFIQASDFTLLCKGKSIDMNGKEFELKTVLKKEDSWIYQYYFYADGQLYLSSKSRVEITPTNYVFGKSLGRDFNGLEDKSESWHELNRQNGVLTWFSINTRENIFNSSSKIVNKTMKFECEKYNLITKF
jgi:hypothetical protein